MSQALARRGPLLGLGALALVTGVWAGLTRLGAAPPGPASPLAHGPLMIGAFLGTVISLERAVAARTRWAMLAPALCGLGALALLVSRADVAAWLLVAGSALVLGVQVQVLRGGAELHLVALALAAISWLVGNVLFARGVAMFDVVPFWVVFLVGTIAAERLELTRLLPRSARSTALFVALFALMLAGPPVALLARDTGLRLFGAGALGLSAWLFHFDVARRTVKQPGMVRFIAVALLAGYAWLGLGGALALIEGHPLAGPAWDALLHTLLIGFVFSMIFGHALVIVPAILGVKVPFHRRYYAHLALLHASLTLRLTGDLAGAPSLRQVGAWLNAAAIALFIISTATAVISAAVADGLRASGGGAGA